MKQKIERAIDITGGPDVLDGSKEWIQKVYEFFSPKYSLEDLGRYIRLCANCQRPSERVLTSWDKRLEPSTLCQDENFDDCLTAFDFIYSAMEEPQSSLLAEKCNDHLQTKKNDIIEGNGTIGAVICLAFIPRLTIPFDITNNLDRLWHVLPTNVRQSLRFLTHRVNPMLCAAGFISADGQLSKVCEGMFQIEYEAHKALKISRPEIIPEDTEIRRLPDGRCQVVEDYLLR